MVSKILKFGKQKGSSLSLPEHGRAGARATSLLATHFAKRNTKFGGESEGGQKFLSPNPFPFCPPERSFSKVGIGIFPKKSSNFNQKTQQYTIFSFFRLVLRLAASRLGAEMGQISETFFARRAKKN